MQFLKTLFWVVLAVVVVLFSHANWNVVTLNLWGGLEADVKLPVLVIGAFLLGLVPTFILYRAKLWSLRRRHETQFQARVANAPGTPTPGTPATSSVSEAEPVRL